MTIETERYDSGATVTRMTECPLCGAELKRQQGLARHLRYNCPEN